MVNSPSNSAVSIQVAVVAVAATFEIWRRFLRGPEDKKKAVAKTDDSGDKVTIGSRGVAALPAPLSYLSSFFRCLQDPCDVQYNPQGYIALCIAENKLVTDLIADRLIQPGTAAAAFSDAEVYGYSSFLGLPVARSAVAYFLAKKFLSPDNKNLNPAEALELISPERIALGSGVAALLNYLFYILGEKGDCCLIPAPYYAAFEADMSVIAGCVPFAVRLTTPEKGPTIDELNLAYDQAQAKGMNVRFLLITNPHNPLGIIYDPQTIKSVVQWAREKGLHIIMDEIYALSYHKKDGQKFQSIIRIMNNDLGSDIHFLWALSKDFGASGFRVGTLYTQNEQLLAALANLNIFSGVSHPIQMITAEILTDDPFVDSFLDTSRERLIRSYEICSSKLDEMVIPYVQAEACIFLYADFSSLLPRKDSQGEAMLSELLTNYARIVLTPGDSQRDSRPGWFRICYASVSPEVLEIAMERLSRLVVKVRKMDWYDLNAATLESVLSF